jgi:UTP-glucose-1-phosphate uridylyltransferase
LHGAIIVTNPAKPILGYVARDFMVRSDLRVVLVSQDRPAGLGDAMMRARPLVGDHPFAVVLPDNLFRGPNQASAVLAAWDRYAAATPIGRFVLPADIFGKFHELAQSLPPGAELDDVPVLQRLARRNALVGVRCDAEFFDVGVPEG